MKSWGDGVDDNYNALPLQKWELAGINGRALNNFHLYLPGSNFCGVLSYHLTTTENSREALGETSLTRAGVKTGVSRKRSQQGAQDFFEEICLTATEIGIDQVKLRAIVQRRTFDKEIWKDEIFLTEFYSVAWKLYLELRKKGYSIFDLTG